MASKRDRKKTNGSDPTQREASRDTSGSGVAEPKSRVRHNHAMTMANMRVAAGISRDPVDMGSLYLS